MLISVMLVPENWCRIPSFHLISRFKKKKLNKHRGNPRWITNAKMLGKQSVEMSFSMPRETCRERNFFSREKEEFFFLVEIGDKASEGN